MMVIDGTHAMPGCIVYLIHVGKARVVIVGFE